MKRPVVYADNNIVLKWSKRAYLTKVNCPVYQENGINISTHTIYAYGPSGNQRYLTDAYTPGNVYTLQGQNVTSSGVLNKFVWGRPPLFLTAVYNPDLFSFPKPIDLSDKNINQHLSEFAEYVRQYVGVVNDTVQRHEQAVKQIICTALTKTVADHVKAVDALTPDEKTRRMGIAQEHVDKYKENMVMYITEYKLLLDKIYSKYVLETDNNKQAVDQIVNEKQQIIETHTNKIYSHLLQYIRDTKHIAPIAKLEDAARNVGNLLFDKIQSGLTLYTTASSIDVTAVKRQLDDIDHIYNATIDKLKVYSNLTTVEQSALDSELEKYQNAQVEFTALKHQLDNLITPQKTKEIIKQQLQKVVHTHRVALIINKEIQILASIAANNVVFNHYKCTCPIKKTNRYLLELNLQYYYRFYTHDSMSFANLFTTVNVRILLNDNIQLLQHVANPDQDIALFHLWEPVTDMDKATLTVRVELGGIEKHSAFQLVVAFPYINNYFSVMKV